MPYNCFSIQLGHLVPLTILLHVLHVPIQLHGVVLYYF